MFVGDRLGQPAYSTLVRHGDIPGYVSRELDGVCGTLLTSERDSA